MSLFSSSPLPITSKMASLLTSPLTKPKPKPLFLYSSSLTLPHPRTLSTLSTPPSFNFTAISLNNHQKVATFRPLTLVAFSEKGFKRDVTVAAAVEGDYRRIVLSDVLVKRKKEKAFWGRRWNSMDLGALAVVLSMHLLCLFAPFQFNWRAVSVAFGLYIITGLLGITLSYHRNLSHKSFKLPKWLEYLFAYCGAQALQGHPIDWVSTHRYHHQFCDSERDPHSPLDGFWFSHMSWMFDSNTLTERCGVPTNVGDLEKQPFYQFLKNTYVFHPVAMALALYAIGGFPFIVWGMGVRIVWVYHITWLVNSACHVWGKQAWNTGDLSRNNWWVATLAFGEGWHNNHHAFEFSARHGLEWWQLDMTWYVVKFLKAIGLATDVKLPTEAQKKRMAFISD